MPDPKYVDFRPAWWRESDDKDPLVELGPLVGSVAEGWPRILTRLVLRDHATAISARTLIDTVDLTQDIVQYAACDKFHGINPDFADLRTAGTEVLLLSRLTIDPFEEGSFVIPARLEAKPVEVTAAGNRHVVSTQDVVQRFENILAAFRAPQEVTDVSIGALLSIEELGRVIRREAEAIEYSAFDAIGQPSQPILVTQDTIARVSQVRAKRRPSQSRLESLEGKITALDIDRHTLYISLRDSGRRVKGAFSLLFQPRLVECLGRTVRLHGVVERRRKQPFSIQVESVEVPNEDE